MWVLDTSLFEEDLYSLDIPSVTSPVGPDYTPSLPLPPIPFSFLPYVFSCGKSSASFLAIPTELLCKYS